MLKLSCLLFILFGNIEVFAQARLFNTDSLLKKYSSSSLKKFPQVSISHEFPQVVESIELIPDTAFYSHSSALGQVYILPGGGNMPCIRLFNTESGSGNKSVLPVRRIVRPAPANNKMPNVYEGRSMIFKAPVTLIE